METIKNVGLEKPMEVKPSPSKKSDAKPGNGFGEVKKGVITPNPKPLEPRQIQIQK